MQDSPIDLRCEIYINTQISDKELRDQVCKLLGILNTGFYLSFENQAEFEIDTNDFYSSDLSEEEKKDWGNFPLFMYLAGVDGQTLENQIALITKLLEYFWSQGYPARASCKFPHLLPRNGGYDPINSVIIE